MLSRTLHRDGLARYSTSPKAGRLTGAGAALVLHAVVIVALLQFQPVRSALIEATPIMVSLITPPAPVLEKPGVLPKPLPVKPQLPQVQPAPEPPSLVTAATEAPLPPAAPAPHPEAPPPAPAPVLAPPAPPPVIPPNFNAAYLNNPPPAYPASARRMGQQGRVVLRVLVNTGGTADKVELRASSGTRQLDDAALEAVRRWRFVPARQGDRPVSAWVLVPIVFTLEG